MSQPVELALIEAAYNRLSGADSHGTPLTHDGNEVPVYTGSAPTDSDAPYVLIGRPRTRGDETLDGVEKPEVRLQLRAHTRHPSGRADFWQAYEIADNAHDLLEAAPISVNGHEPYVPEPDKQPIPPYNVEDESALDLSLDYVFPSL
jgi:hypothetical protein